MQISLTLIDKLNERFILFFKMSKLLNLVNVFKKVLTKHPCDLKIIWAMSVKLSIFACGLLKVEELKNMISFYFRVLYTLEIWNVSNFFSSNIFNIRTIQGFTRNDSIVITAVIIILIELLKLFFQDVVSGWLVHIFAPQYHLIARGLSF